MCVSESVWSQNSESVIFISVRCLEMLKIAIWKNDVIHGYGFWTIYLLKRYINLEFFRPDIQVWFYNMSNGFMKILKIFNFVKSYLKILVFYFLSTKVIFWKIRDSHFEELLVVQLVMLFICILLKIHIFGDFFNHLSIFAQKWHDIGSLKSL